MRPFQAQVAAYEGPTHQPRAPTSTSTASATVPTLPSVCRARPSVLFFCGRTYVGSVCVCIHMHTYYIVYYICVHVCVHAHVYARTHTQRHVPTLLHTTKHTHTHCTTDRTDRTGTRTEVARARPHAPSSRQLTLVRPCVCPCSAEAALAATTAQVVACLLRFRLRPLVKQR